MANGMQDFLAALENNPQDVEAIGGLERALSESSDWGILVEELPALARGLDDATARVQFLARAAHVARNEMEGEGALADELFGEIAADGASHDEVVAGVQAAYADEQDWKALVNTFLELFSAAAEDKARGARLLYAAGRTYEDKLFDRERAVPFYQKAFKQDSTFTEPLEAARAIYRQTEHWGTVAKLYSVELKVTDEPARKAEILKELGDLNAEKIRDYEAALTHYQAARGLGVSIAGIDEAIAAAEATLAEDAEGVEIAGDLLDDGAAEEQQGTGAASAPAAAAPSRPAARRASRAAASSDADVPPAPEVEPAPDTIIMPAHDMSSASREYVDFLLDVARESEGRLATTLYGRAVDRLFALDADTDEVVEIVLEAVDRAADGVVAVRDLMVSLIDRRFTCESILEALAENNAPGDAQYAMAFYGAGNRERANELRDQAGDWGLIDAAALEWADKGNWRKAYNAISAAFEGHPEAEAEAYRVQAYICIGLDQPDKAADSLRRVLRKNKNERAGLELAAAIYKWADRANNYADALKNLVGNLDDSDSAWKASMLREMAVVYRDELKQDLMVVNAYQQLAEIEPTNIAVLDELSKLLIGMNRFQDLPDVLRKKAEATEDPEARLGVYRELATFLEERSSNQNDAIAAWEDVLALAPSDADALARLDSLYEKRREWEKLIDIKRRRLEQEGPEAGIAYLREAAEVAAMRMRDQDLANELWNEVLQVDPNDTAALGALEQLYERGKDWANLADILSRKVELLDDDTEKSQAYLKLGQIYGDRLSEPEAALHAWEALLELEPENFRAKDAVKKAYIELERWDDLEAFFARDDSWADYVRLIEAQAGNVSDPDEQVDLLFRAARTYIDRLDTPERATRALERVLQTDPDNAEAARLLVPIYEERNDIRKLPDVLRTVLDHTTDDEERFTLLGRLAELNASQLRNYDEGLAFYAEALAIRPGETSLYEPMLEAAERADNGWAVVDGAYAEARIALDGQPDAADAWLQLTRLHADMLETQVQDYDAALDAAEAILNLHPGDEKALAARERIFRQRGDWDALLDVLDQRLEQTEGTEARAEILREICRIHQDEREDAFAAIDRYRELRDLVGGRDVVVALRGLYRVTEQWPEWLESSRELLADADGAEAREIYLELASVQVQELDAVNDAVESYATVLEEHPSDREAREGLEALVEQDEVRARVARVLRPVYERASDWRMVVEMLEIEAEEADSSERAALLTRIGELQGETLRDPESAFDAWSRLLQLDPGSERAQRELETLSEQRRNWAPLVELYEEVLGMLPQGSDDERALAVSYGEKIARIYDERLDMLDEAVNAHQNILTIDPQRWSSRRALTDDLLPRAERWNDLVDQYAENINLMEEAGERREARARLAEIFESRLGDADEAIRVWTEVVAESPEDMAALEALDNLHGSVGDASAQADVIRQRIGLLSAGSAEQIELKLRLARLQDEQLGDLNASLELLREVVEVSPRNESTRGYLEELLANEDAALHAAEILQPLYTEDGDNASLSTVLAVRLQFEDDPASRQPLFHQLAVLQSQELEDHAAAFETRCLGLREFPADADMLAGAYQEAELTGDWAQLSATLNDLADEVADPDVATDLRSRVARIQSEYLADEDGAADAWRRVLEVEPSSTEALNALDGIYEASGQWEELVEILQRKAELGDERDAIAVQFRAAAVYEQHLGQSDEAIETLRNILMRDPDNAQALDELERLYEGAERWDDLVEVYEQKTRLASSDEVRRGLLMQMGMVLQEALGDDDRAADAYRQVLASNEQDVEALEALNRTFRRTENWTDLLDVLRKQQAIASEEEKTAIGYDIAYLQESELADIPAAIASYTAVLERDPDYPPAVEALQGLIARGEAVNEAAGLLEPIYKRNEMWSELIELNNVKLDNAFDPAQRRSIFLENAELFEQRLQMLEDAWVSRRRAFEEAPDAGDPAALERLSEELANWEALEEVFDQMRDEAPEPGLRRDLGVRLARIREEQLDDKEGAIEAFIRVQEENPEDGKALESLDRLYQQTGNWEALVDVLRQRIAVESNETERNRLRLRQANVLYEFMDDGPEAIRVFQEVLSTDDRDPDAIAALEAMASTGVEVTEVAGILEPTYRQHEQWSDLVRLYEIRLEHEDLPDERYIFLSTIAGVYENEMAEPSAALSTWVRALAERPSDPTARERIEAIAESNGLWAEASTGYSEVLVGDITDDERAELAKRTAQIASEKLGDQQAAEQAWLTALEVQPEDNEALEALDAIYVSAEAWEQLSAILERRRETVFDTDQLVEITARHARLYQQQLGDIAAAEETWIAVTDLAPDHREALSALEGLYESQGQAEALYDIYDRQLQIATSPEERTPILRLMARLCATSLERPEDAVDTWNRLLGEAPGDIEALESLAELHLNAGEYNELVDVLRRRIELSDDEDQQVELLRMSAQVLGDQLENDHEAVETWKQLIALRPEDTEAHIALQILYDRMGDEPNLAKNLEREIELGLFEEDQLASVYERLGRIYSGVTAEPQKAIAAWNEVLQRDPVHEEALQQLDELYTAEQRWEELVVVLEQKAEVAAADEEKIDLFRRTATIWTTERPDADKAARAWENVVDLDLTDMQAISALEELYPQLEAWDALAQLYVDRLEVLEDEFERQQAMAAAARLYSERLEQPEGAFLLSLNAVTEAPLEEDARANVERYAEMAGTWSDLAGTYQQLIDTVSAEHGEDEALPLIIKLAWIQDQKLDDLTMAEVFYDRALTLDAENEEVLSALESIYRREESWSDLVRVLRAKAELVFDPEVQLGLYKEIGRIHEELRNDNDAAAEALYMALDINESDNETFDSLERVLEARETWVELVDTLDRRTMQMSDPAQITETKLRIGRIWRDRAAEYDRAIEGFNDVLMSDPENTEAFEALEQLYGQQELWDDFVEILDRRAAVESDPEIKVALFGKQAQVQQAVFEDIDMAVSSLQRALDVKPDHLESIETLEDIFIDQERWYDLVEIYERHVTSTDDPAEQAEVLVALGETLTDEMEDLQGGVRAFERALEVEPENVTALKRAAELFVTLEDPANAVSRYDRLAAAVSEPAERRDALLRAADLMTHEQVQNFEGAEERLLQVLGDNEEDLDALDGLYNVYCARQMWDQAIDALRRRIELTAEMNVRSELLANLADIHQTQLNDVEKARDIFEEAIDLAPDNIYAAAPLADIYMAEERWERAQPLLELLVNDERYQENDEAIAQLHHMLGRCYEELAQDQDAVSEYRKVLEFQPNHPDALLRVARLLKRLEDYGEAYNYLMDYIGAWQSELQPAELAEAWCEAGEIRAAEGDVISAQQNYESALQVDPNFAPALRGLVDLSSEGLDPASVIEAKSRLLTHTEDETERFKLRIDIGDAHMELGNYGDAVTNYREAVRMNANSKAALSKLLRGYQMMGNWQKATEVLGQLAAMESDPKRKAKLLQAIGAMFRDELGDFDKANEFFNLALDEDPTKLDTFQELDALLTEARDWKAQERAYVQMLKRISQGTSDEILGLRKMLLRGLGEIYISRLDSPKKALQAFQLASDIDPDDEKLLERLAALYADHGEPQDAVAAHRRLIARSPFRIESYQALFEAYIRRQEPDPAWNMAAALNAIGRAGERETKFYESHLAARPAQPRKPLSKENWRSLRHPDLDPNLTDLFALLAVNLKPYVGDIRDYNLNRKKDRIDLSEQTPLTRATQLAIRIVGVNEPQLYVRREDNGLRNPNVDPPAVLVGNDMLQAKPERELAFETARVMTLMRPEFYLASALMASEYLKVVLAAALAVRTGQIIGTDNAADAQELAHAIQRLPEQVQLQIQTAVQRLLESGRNPDVSAWLKAVDHTASRVGLLLCGDLRTASNMIKDEAHQIGKASPKDKIRELIVFAISEEYFELREELGLAIGD